MVLYTTCLLFEKKLEPKSDKVKVKVEKICSILEFVKVTTLELSSNDNGEKNVTEKGVLRLASFGPKNSKKKWPKNILGFFILLSN